MADLRIVDVGDPDVFALIPPCADPRFDHRTCDYWEDAERGSKASRTPWLEARASRPPARRADLTDNPFAPTVDDAPENPFAPGAATQSDNPFAPTSQRERPLREGVPRKLALLDRGRGVFGSYAKVLLADDEAVAYCQFGPLSAYPRATRLRQLYPQLPDAPLPAVITCIATTAEARAQGYAHQLIDAVLDDLAARGFSAIEAYPDLTRGNDETSAGSPQLWNDLGFVTAVDDERFPVMRRDL